MPSEGGVLGWLVWLVNGRGVGGRCCIGWGVDGVLGWFGLGSGVEWCVLGQKGYGMFKECSR